MPTNLVDYINAQLKLGINEVTIKAELSTHDWTQDQINEAFTQINSPASAPPSQSPVPTIPNVNQNTSGMKDSSTIPNEVKGFSWGGFLLTWIWGIGNNTWIGLLALLPFLSLIIAFVLGFKGREWAWKNKHWDSIDHFKSIQRKWAIWGLVIPGFFVVVFLFGFFTYFLHTR